MNNLSSWAVTDTSDLGHIITCTSSLGIKSSNIFRGVLRNGRVFAKRTRHIKNSETVVLMFSLTTYLKYSDIRERMTGYTIVSPPLRVRSLRATDTGNCIYDNNTIKDFQELRNKKRMSGRRDDDGSDRKNRIVYLMENKEQQEPYKSGI